MNKLVYISTLIIVFWMTINNCYSQSFTFSSAGSTKIEIKFNSKLKPLLDRLNYKELQSLFKQDPKIVNQASVKYSGYYNEIKKAMLHDVFDECMTGKYPIEMLKFILQNGADPYIEYMDLPILYRLMNYIAENPISKCSKAVEIFNLLSTDSNIDFSRQHRDLLPPFAYLLRKNFDFLNGKYDVNYIPQSIIITFIKKGVNVNTFDQEGNNVLTYAIQTHNTQIQQFLFENGINAEKKNKHGLDAMSNAILLGSMESIKELVNNGYKLTPTKLMEIGMDVKFDKNNNELTSCLSDISFSQIENYSDIKNYILLFDDKKKKLLENNFYLQKGVIRSNLIDFIKLMEKNNPSFDEHEKNILLNEKIKYFNKCTTFDELIKGIEAFPHFPEFTSLVDDKAFAIVNNEKTDENFENYLKLFSNKERIEFIEMLYVKNVTTKIRDLNSNSDEIGLYNLHKNYSKSCNKLIRELSQLSQSFYNQINENRHQDFEKAVKQNSGNTLVKVIFKTRDGLPAFPVINSVVNMMKDHHIVQYDIGNLIGITNPDKGSVFSSIDDKITYYDNGVINASWYREGTQKTGDMDLKFNSGFYAFEKALYSFAASNGINIEYCGYLGSFEADKQMRAEREQARINYRKSQCEKCEIDWKKSESSGDVEHWLWGTVHKTGKIVMKNGEEYEFDIYNGKLEMSTGLFSSKKFNSYKEMIDEFLEKCQNKYCN